MLSQISGLHHVTSLASDAQENNTFFTQILGLRRIKKTVNFDVPEVYHLYYGDELGTPGSVMTYFPFPGKKRGRPGTGEVGRTDFSIPTGSLKFWQKRFADLGITGLAEKEVFGEKCLQFSGPDGDGFSLVENNEDERRPWTSTIADDVAIRGFHGASIRLEDDGATAELLQFMGYQPVDKTEDMKRFAIPDGNGAHNIDLIPMPGGDGAAQGAGSVHHIAFAVKDRQHQLDVRRALLDTGYQVTPVIDRNYFWAIYFRTPGGVLFEIATNEPGFDHDEDTANLGEALKLPIQHEHLRNNLQLSLPKIADQVPKHVNREDVR